MRIANPIYDVVFRYLLEDNEVAKLFLSALIDEEIVELEVRPTEIPLKYDTILTVLRMDFSAKIRTKTDELKLIIIELQKAKYYLEVMRFRRYLAKQYNDAKLKYVENLPSGQKVIKGIPIFPIYILGDKITKETIPVLRVGRQYIDVATKQVYHFKDHFIEALTHDGLFIQVPYLTGNTRTELEQLLHVFDQSNADRNAQYHILEIDEDEYPEKYRKVIRRLKKAMADKQILDQMEAEDDFIELIKFKEANIMELEIIAENAIKMAEEAKKKAEETERKAKETERKAEETERKAKETEEKIEKNNALVIRQLFNEQNMSVETLAAIYKKTVAEIEQIVAKK